MQGLCTYTYIAIPPDVLRYMHDFIFTTSMKNNQENHLIEIRKSFNLIEENDYFNLSKDNELMEQIP